MSLRHLGKAVLPFTAARTPRPTMVTCLNSLSEVPAVAAHPSRAPAFPALSSMAQKCQSHCFLCWSYVVSVPELQENHEKILTFLCRLMQLLSMQTLKNGKSLALSSAVGKYMVHVCLLGGTTVCPERACWHTTGVLKDVVYTAPTEKASAKARLSRWI